MEAGKFHDEIYIDDQMRTSIQSRQNTKVVSALCHANLNNVVDPAGFKLLHLSVRYNNVFLTEFLIERGVQIDSLDINDETLLMMALKYKHAKQVELLLAANADIRAANSRGESVLTMVFRLRHIGEELKIIKCFLTKLAVIYMTEEKLARVLIDAGCSLDKVVYLNSPSMVTRMLEYGYEVNTKHSNNSNNTALHVAAMLNYLSTIHVLIKYGADIRISNKRGHIPLVHAIVHQPRQDPHVLEALMPQNFNWTENNLENDFGGRLPLFYIFERGNQETLVSFQRRYAIDLTARDQYGETPLHYLIRNENEGILELFSNAEFHLDAQDFRMKTSALHLAAMSGLSHSVKFLLERGAKTDTNDCFGLTPLLVLFNTPAKCDIDANASSKMKNLAECVELLMLYSAGSEVVSRVNFRTAKDTLFWAKYLKRYSLIKPVLAHFAILDILGIPMEQLTRDQIQSDVQLKNYYALCKQQLEKTKTHFLRDRITVYKILTEPAKNIALYTRRQEIMTDKLKNIDFELESYYRKLIKKRLCDARRTNNWRENAGLLLSELIGLSDANHLVIDRICCLLNERDLKVINIVMTVNND